jgi:hypothetical protein
VNCEKEVQSLRKIMNAKQYTEEPDLAYIFDSWKLSNSGIRELMLYHKDSGGTHATVEGAACAWLKDNFQTWRPWARIEKPCGLDGAFTLDSETKKCVRVPKTRPESYMFAVMVIPVASAVGFSIALFFIFLVRAL